MSSREISVHAQTPISRDQSYQVLSASSSPTKYRETHGIEKFYLSRKKKQMETEVELISNKINLLLKLENEAKRKTEIAKHKAENIKKAQERNELKLKEREILKEVRKREEESLRKRNLKQKQKSLETKRNLQESIYKERRNFARVIKQQRHEFDEESRSFKERLKRQKSQIKHERIGEMMQHKANSQYFTIKIKKDLKQAYEDRISEEKTAYLDLMRQKAELEKQEAELIQTYAKTLSQEKETFKILETVSKVPLYQLGFR